MALFTPLTLRGLTLRNRVGVSPMCQYSCHDGMATDWHLVHLGSRAVGGAALVMAEATAVEAIGRISPDDLGLWTDAHAEPLQRVARFIREQGAAPAIQLAHAGRKASTYRPWSGRGAVPVSNGGWIPVGPGDEAFTKQDPTPRALKTTELPAIAQAFAKAATRALEAGFEVVEVHAAHGYLLHSFLSPLSNHRTDEYGGSFDNRVRLLLEVVDAIRAGWPERNPLLVRISATDWTEGGWEVTDSVELARRLKTHGVDLVDCSSGGNVPKADIPVGPGYQVPLADRVRREAGIATAAVGMLTEARQVEEIIASGKADMAFMARELLRDAYWPLHAAHELGVELKWPEQYQRAKPISAREF